MLKSPRLGGDQVLQEWTGSSMELVRLEKLLSVVDSPFELVQPHLLFEPVRHRAWMGGGVGAGLQQILPANIAADLANRPNAGRSKALTND